MHRELRYPIGMVILKAEERRDRDREKGEERRDRDREKGEERKDRDREKGDDEVTETAPCRICLQQRESASREASPNPETRSGLCKVVL